MINKNNLPKQQYPPEIINLLTTTGFLTEFYSQCRAHATDKAAFEFLNDLHEQYFGRQKYSDYESFKTIRKRIARQFKAR